jgi:MYXO-CTERM domain-containing protein
MRGLVSVRVGLFAVGLAACGLGGAEPGEAPEHRVEAPGGITEAAAVAVVEERLAPAPSSAGLDALPWAERIPLERALAERDPVHAPRLDEGGVPSLGAGPLRARFDAAGAHVAVGGHELALRAVAIGRGDVSAPLAEAPQTLAGPEVRAERGAGVTEWWRSLPSGLEHGLTLAERPPGEGALRIELALGGLRATSRSEDAVELRDATGQAVATYAHLIAWDADAHPLSGHLETRSGAIVLALDDAAARYPLVIDPLFTAAEEASLTASDRAAGDRLGVSVSLSADGQRAMAGAPTDDTSAGMDAGSARVFVRTATGWIEEAILVAFDAAPGEDFGGSVSLSADGSRALVGMRRDAGPGGNGAGSARVFVRSGTTWTEEATLRAFDGATNDQLGHSVSLSADGARALVGVPNDMVGEVRQAGSARVFVRTGTTWVEEATLLPPLGAATDLFGSAVALSADGLRAIVGAPNDDVAGASDAGSATVFVRTELGWVVEASLTAGAAGASLGHSVALSADGHRALVGAPFAAVDSVLFAGSARVFDRTAAGWTTAATLSASDGEPSAGFGQSVALSGDGRRALVGMSRDDTPGGLNAGSARVFELTDSAWQEDVTLWAFDGAASDGFGESVALSSDGDVALVGSNQDDLAGNLDAGSARVFRVRPASANGAGCLDGANCLSGHCVDGVCCNDACGGGGTDCQACSVSAGGLVDGTCGPLTAVAALAVTCRTAADVCDAPEACSPASISCPADGVVEAGTVCRTAAGECDLPESCSGSSIMCPADARRPTGTECRTSLGACDPAEACDGLSPVCPSNAFLPFGTVCGVGMGSCASAAACNGTSAACPATGVRAAGTLCRAASGPCDADDFCDGTSPACVDGFAPPTQRCGGPPSGVCDAEDYCTGTSGDCMPTFLSGVECRGSRGACDAAEVCAGSSPECPPDGLLSAGVVCRASSDTMCDPAEACDGTSSECPADETMCEPDAGPADAGAVEPGDAGPNDAGERDGGASTDAGGVSIDAGAAPVPASGCGCRAGSGPGTGLSALVALALALALGLRRR